MGKHLNLDWGHWIYGLVGGFIGGGSSSVVAGALSIGIAPDKFNLGDHIGNTVKMLLGCFILNGIVSAALWLKQKPLPDIETEITETTTVIEQPQKTTRIDEKVTTITSPNPPADAGNKPS